MAKIKHVGRYGITNETIKVYLVVLMENGKNVNFCSQQTVLKQVKTAT